MKSNSSNLLLRLFSIGAGLPLLVSCSLVPLFYEQLPRVAVGRLDDAFNLSRTQKSDLKADLVDLLQWHRTEHLPRYEQALAEFDSRLEDGAISPADVDWALDQVEVFRRELTAKVYEKSPRFLRSLSREQIDHFEEQSKERYQERFEHLDFPPNEATDRITERWEDRLENWSGSLNQSQLQILRKTAEATLDEQKIKKEKTLALHQAFLKVLRTELQLSDTELIKKLFEITPPTRGTALHEAYRAMLIDISSSLTERQLAHMRKEIQEWKEKVNSAQSP